MKKRKVIAAKELSTSNKASGRSLKTWDKKFKAAIRSGNEPEGDLFEGVANEFDKTEW